MSKTNKKTKNTGFFSNDYIMDRKEAPTKTKKDNPFFYDNSRKTEKTEDFTDDGSSYKTDKSQTKWNLVGTLAEAYNIWQNALKAGDQETIERAAKVYWDLKSYVTADFTDDGSAYNYNLLRELADSWKSFTTERDPEKSRRAHQLFRELFEDLKSKLNELDKLKRK